MITNSRLKKNNLLRKSRKNIFFYSTPRMDDESKQTKENLTTYMDEISNQAEIESEQPQI